MRALMHLSTVKGVGVVARQGDKARVVRATPSVYELATAAIVAGHGIKAEVEKRGLGDAVDLSRATFAAGCFWGLELAFQREPGVVATKVGYTHGATSSPTYEQVCSGTTGHTEAVQVAYDTNEVCSCKQVERVPDECNSISDRERKGLRGRGA